jgi:hypothetical protein
VAAVALGLLVLVAQEGRTLQVVLVVLLTAERVVLALTGSR